MLYMYYIYIYMLYMYYIYIYIYMMIWLYLPAFVEHSRKTTIRLLISSSEVVTNGKNRTNH